MDYMTRLLTRPGDTAQGPFDDTVFSHMKPTSPADSRTSITRNAFSSLLGMDEAASCNEDEETCEGDTRSVATRATQDQSLRSAPSIARASSVISRLSNAVTSRESSARPGPDGLLLKSIVTDPRQRLARLLTNAPLQKEEHGVSVHEPPMDLVTPASASVYSDEHLIQRFRQRYDSVFEQLDSLMHDSGEYDEDRLNYGKKILQALHPDGFTSGLEGASVVETNNKRKSGGSSDLSRNEQIVVPNDHDGSSSKLRQFQERLQVMTEDNLQPKLSRESLIRQILSFHEGDEGFLLDIGSLPEVSTIHGSEFNAESKNQRHQREEAPVESSVHEPPNSAISKPNRNQSHRRCLSLGGDECASPQTGSPRGISSTPSKEHSVHSTSSSKLARNRRHRYSNSLGGNENVSIQIGSPEEVFLTPSEESPGRLAVREPINATGPKPTQNLSHRRLKSLGGDESIPLQIGSPKEVFSTPSKEPPLGFKVSEPSDTSFSDPTRNRSHRHCKSLGGDESVSYQIGSPRKVFSSPSKESPFGFTAHTPTYTINSDPTRNRSHRHCNSLGGDDSGLYPIGTPREVSSTPSNRRFILKREHSWPTNRGSKCGMSGQSNTHEEDEHFQSPDGVDGISLNIGPLTDISPIKGSPFVSEFYQGTSKMDRSHRSDGSTGSSKQSLQRQDYQPVNPIYGVDEPNYASGHDTEQPRGIPGDGSSFQSRRNKTIVERKPFEFIDEEGDSFGAVFPPQREIEFERHSLINESEQGRSPPTPSCNAEMNELCHQFSDITSSRGSPVPLVDQRLHRWKSVQTSRERTRVVNNTTFDSSPGAVEQSKRSPAQKVPSIVVSSNVSPSESIQRGLSSVNDSFDDNLNTNVHKPPHANDDNHRHFFGSSHSSHNSPGEESPQKNRRTFVDDRDSVLKLPNSKYESTQNEVEAELPNSTTRSKQKLVSADSPPTGSCHSQDGSINASVENADRSSGDAIGTQHLSNATYQNSVVDDMSAANDNSQKNLSMISTNQKTDFLHCNSTSQSKHETINESTLKGIVREYEVPSSQNSDSFPTDVSSDVLSLPHDDEESVTHNVLHKARIIASNDDTTSHLDINNDRVRQGTFRLRRRVSVEKNNVLFSPGAGASQKTLVLKSHLSVEDDQGVIDHSVRNKNDEVVDNDRTINPFTVSSGNEKPPGSHISIGQNGSSDVSRLSGSAATSGESSSAANPDKKKKSPNNESSNASSNHDLFTMVENLQRQFDALSLKTPGFRETPTPSEKHGDKQAFVLQDHNRQHTIHDVFAPEPVDDRQSENGPTINENKKNALNLEKQTTLESEQSDNSDVYDGDASDSESSSSTSRDEIRRDRFMSRSSQDMREVFSQQRRVTTSVSERVISTTYSESTCWTEQAESMNEQNTSKSTTAERETSAAHKQPKHSDRQKTSPNQETTINQNTTKQENLATTSSSERETSTVYSEQRHSNEAEDHDKKGNLILREAPERMTSLTHNKQVDTNTQEISFNQSPSSLAASKQTNSTEHNNQNHSHDQADSTHQENPQTQALNGRLRSLEETVLRDQSLMRNLQQELDSSKFKSMEANAKLELIKNEMIESTRAREYAEAELLKARDTIQQHAKSAAGLEREVAALKERMNSLNEEKMTTTAFLQKIESFMDEKAQRKSSSQKQASSSCVADNKADYQKRMQSLEDSVRQRQALLETLQVELESSRIEKVAVMQKLQTIGINFEAASRAKEYAEKELTKAEETIAAHAQSATALETEIRQLKEQLKEINSSNTVSLRFLETLETMLNGDDSATRLSVGQDSQSLAPSERQHSIILETIENLQARLKQLIDENNKLKILLEETLSRESTNKQTISSLKSKVDALQHQVKQLQSSCSQEVKDRLAAEKIADETLSTNESLSKEISDLKGQLSQLQRDHAELAETHTVVIEREESLSISSHRTKKLIAERDVEISKMKEKLITCQGTTAQLESQLKEAEANGLATAEEMKKHTETIKTEYKKRLETFKKTISLQQEKIAELERQNLAKFDRESESSAEISRLKLELSQGKAENASVRRRIEQTEKLMSSKLTNTEGRLYEINQQLSASKEELASKKEENKSLKNELKHLREIMDIAEKSVGELNRLKEENVRLNEVINSHKDHQTQTSAKDIGDVPREIRSRLYSDSDTFFQDGECFVHERVSALMRENEQNNISMKSLQRENITLRSSIEECTETIEHMRSEINDLKSIASDGVSKLHRREKSLIEERRKDRSAMSDIEKKLEHANNTIRTLRTSCGCPVIRPVRSYEQGQSVSEWEPPSLQPSDSLSESKYSYLEINRRVMSPISNSLGSSWQDRKFAAELSAEKELRWKAEEICAGVLANAKSGFEERDSEIKRLKSKLLRMTNHKSTHGPNR